MAHLVYSGNGVWDRVEPAYSMSCSVKEWNVEPKPGDTFTEFTSRPNAIGDVQRRHGIKACVKRTAMWGERDFVIVEDNHAGQKTQPQRASETGASRAQAGAT